MDNREIQITLSALGFPVDVDGKIGKQSREAVEAFQKAYGLYVDGVPGKQTQTALKQAVAALKPGKIEPDKSAINGDVPHTFTKAATPAPPPNSPQLLATSRPINEIIWHCTATPEGKDYTVSDIRAWHKARGFSDVGYHYIVYRDGRIMLGRPVGQIGAHVEGHNTGTIGCSYVGGVSADGKFAKDTRTPAQTASMLWLTKQLLGMHRSAKKVTGHNQYANKACPSFDVRKDPLGKLV